MKRTPIIFVVVMAAVLGGCNLGDGIDTDTSEQAIAGPGEQDKVPSSGEVQPPQAPDGGQDAVEGKPERGERCAGPGEGDCIPEPPEACTLDEYGNELCPEPGEDIEVVCRVGDDGAELCETVPPEIVDQCAPLLDGIVDDGSDEDSAQVIADYEACLAEGLDERPEPPCPKPDAEGECL